MFLLPRAGQNPYKDEMLRSKVRKCHHWLGRSVSIHLRVLDSSEERSLVEVMSWTIRLRRLILQAPRAASWTPLAIVTIVNARG